MDDTQPGDGSPRAPSVEVGELLPRLDRGEKLLLLDGPAAGLNHEEVESLGEEIRAIDQAVEEQFLQPA